MNKGPINPAYYLCTNHPEVMLISVQFQPKGKEYDFLTRLEVEPGEDVVVETYEGLKVATVSSLHPKPEAFKFSRIKYKWAVSKKGSEALRAQRECHKIQQEICNP